MFTIKKTLKNIPYNKATILLFLLVSFSFPALVKIVVPLFIVVAFFQFYQVLRNKITIDYLLETYFYLLVYSLIFFRSIHTLILVFNLIFYFYYTLKSKERFKISALKNEFLIFFFFCLIVVNQLTFQPYLKTIDTYLYLLFYPLLFFLIKKSKILFTIENALKTFIVSVLTATLFLFFINLFQDNLTLKTNTFFAEPLGLTHVYFGLSLGVAFGFVLILLEKETYLINKISTYFLLAIFLILLIYIGARTSFVATFIILGVFLFKKIPLVFYKKITLLTILSFVFLTISFKTIPRVKQDLFFIKKVYISVTTNDTQDLVQNSWRNIYQRFLVTKYSINEIKENLLLGIGNHNTKRILGGKIHKEGYLYFEAINPHNQYLHVLLGMGLFSFLYFLVMMGNFFKMPSSHMYFLFFFILIMFTESVLVRVKGISIFFLFVLILSLKKSPLHD
ncbi:hypothetical protein KCTC32516_00896 [Polaribacter huanghezhanensis]|uniref:O-antigen ligase family protein n=1 Tax=Polaribacter huanghezhanensis TaxID=1354726 RepID=UPI002647D039|nr:O-antigen ligase family protein [Polaribacter huanghezhanensis]WKD85555.1 hypothetical protein KCTC32516_00896 [Polaribacter huanghezhanensis]